MRLAPLDTLARARSAPVRVPEIPLYQVDAFTDRPFRGNPAAVCPLDAWLPDELLQAIAAENNLSETAFFVGRGDERELRWFTPAVEVDLCGHATLASGFVLLTELEPARREIRFRTHSGVLGVSRSGERCTLDFPTRAPQRAQAPAGLVEALGRAPLEVWQSRDLLALYRSAEDVRALRPDMSALARLAPFAVSATAPGTGADGDVDFVSRFFAPAVGIPEDPVTGSAHCTLTPFWAQRLGRTRLRARQVSARGGEIECELAGERVKLTGSAVLVLRGRLRY